MWAALAAGGQRSAHGTSRRRVPRCRRADPPRSVQGRLAAARRRAGARGRAALGGSPLGGARPAGVGHRAHGREGAAARVSPRPTSAGSARAAHARRSLGGVDGVDLDLSEGRRVALVGASGAGKSTIATALVRFVDYESGSVRLDGTDARDLDSDEVRTIVGLVERDAHIFDSTLHENMRLQPTASDAEIMAALAHAPAVGLGHEPAPRPRHRGRRARLFVVRRPTTAPCPRPRPLG